MISRLALCAGRQVALSVLLMFGCAACSTVRLDRLVAYSAKAVPGRSGEQAAWDASGALRGAYVVADDDEVEIRLLRSDGANVPVSVRPENSPLLLIQRAGVARLRVGLLRKLGGIDIAASGTSTRIDTRLADAATWKQLSDAFDDKEVACGVTRCSLNLSLLPRASAYASPGDVLTLQRSFVAEIPIDGASPLVTTESFAIVVDEQGWVRVPLMPRLRVSSVASMGDQLSTSDGQVGVPELRRVGAHIESSYARVRLWAPQWYGSARRTLEEINDCLSVSAVVPEVAACPRDDEQATKLRLPDGFASRCRAAGIEDQFRSCPAHAHEVHYRLVPGPTTWRLVDESGGERVIAYRYGSSVGDAVRTHYPLLRGRELLFRGVGARSAYVTVVPAESTPRATPFWLHLKKATSVDNDPLLLPGDSVFVSRTKPQPSSGR